jgi:hypothetical protein
VPGPYIFQAGDNLQFLLEDGIVHNLVLTADEFDNPQNAQVDELVGVITQYIRGLGYNGYALTYTDPDTDLKYVQMFGGALGPYGMIQVVGGTIQDQLEFPTIRPTMLPSNTTVWQITQNVGDTYRFTWVSGPQPLLDVVFPGDSVMIYGAQFASYGFYGTYSVSAARPCQPSPSYDSGYFEIQVQNAPIGLSSSQPNIAPPINAPPIYYSYTVTQALYSDLKFFLPNKNVPYEQLRYALAWEPANSLLKVYMPATTEAVARTLLGAAHTHMLYPADELNGSYGSATDPTAQIIIVNDYAFKYPATGDDCDADGGTVTIGATTVDIDYIVRSQNFTTVICTTPISGQATPLSLTGTSGLLLGTPDSFGIIRSTQVCAISDTVALSDDPVHGFLGAYMVDPTANYTLTNQIVTLREPIYQGQSVNTLLVSGVLPNQTGNLLFGLNLDGQESPVVYLASQTASSSSPIAIQSISQFGTTVTVTTVAPSGVLVGENVLIYGTVNFNGQWTVTATPSISVYAFTKSPGATLFESTGQSLPILGQPISTLIMEQSYIFKNNHYVGEDVTLLSAAQFTAPRKDGTDYGFYVTSTEPGQAYAQSVIEMITALGINLEIVIVYPSDVGLGNAGDSELATAPPPAVSDALYVWGPDAE